MTFASSGVLDPQGPVARAIDELWWLMLIVGTAVFIVFMVVLAIALRRGADGRSEPAGGRAPTLIMSIGVGATTLILLVVMVATVQTMRDVPDEADEALQVEIVGHRWWWEVRYPESGVVTANEVHLPVGRPVQFRLTSADVIHSFWIPQLGGKRDLLPEDVNTLVLQADEPGVHRSQCSEFCGLQHAKMGFVAVAEPEDQFRAWLTAQREDAVQPASTSARRGRELFLTAGCARCHSVRGTEAEGEKGPDLTHLASRSRIVAATLANTREQLIRWISDPHEVKSGVDMPALDLSDDEVEAIVTYLESLR